MKSMNFSKAKKKRKLKRYLFFLLFVFCIYISYQLIDQHAKKISQKEFVEILMSENKEYRLLQKLMYIIFSPKKDSISYLIKKNYTNLVEDHPSKTVSVSQNHFIEPLIYIYNSHQTEEYTPSNFVEYSVMPTVQMNNYILEEQFKKKNYSVIVEEKNIKQVLNEHGWNYASSYQASRLFLEEAKKNYPSLKYFIDVHRDSLSKDRTTVTIDQKEYASILFLIGMENPNYSQNLEFTEKINQKINEKYPNLSKGIYKKQGPGVNGVYNQDFSPFSILVEMGGPENTIDEVLNTSLAFADCFLEVIAEYEL